MTHEMFGATKKYDRFSKEEMLEQYRDLAFYIITELSSDDLESIQFSIADVKELTGYDVSIEEAMRMRKLAADRKIKKLCKMR